MKIPGRKTINRFGIATLVVVVVIVGPCVTFSHEMAHQRLNTDLISAIQARNVNLALELVAEGADGSANEADLHQASVGQAFQRLFHIFAHKPHGEPVEANGHRSALLLYYNTIQPTTTDKELIGPPSRLPEALLEANGCVISRNKDRTGVLDYACLYHQHAVVGMLIEQGADVNATNVMIHGLTSLMLADEADARLLLDHGARIDDTGWNRRTALFGADGRKADLLLERGANINVTDTDGYTPLMCACMEGRDETAGKLLAHHASVANRGKYGETAIQCSADSCKLETVLSLVKHGGNPRVKNASGYTFLMAAAENPDTRVFKWAMGQGIDPRARTKSGVTALMCAAGRGRLETVETLVEAGANIHDIWRGDTCLNAAAGNPDARVCEWFVAHGLDVNHAGQGGMTPLMGAASHSKLGAAKALVRAGANINAVNAHGETPLMAAVSNSDPAVLAWLLTLRVDVYKRNADGDTALAMAEHYLNGCYQDRLPHAALDKIVALLKAHGAAGSRQ